MAGLPWFELDVDMPDDPKFVALGERLKNPLAFAYAVRLYAYCYRHATDRFSGPGAVRVIETACGWRGKTGALFSAMRAESVIDQGEGETFIVHGVADRLAPHLTKRERDKDRMRERRGYVAATFERRSAVVAGDKDKDSDKDRSETIGSVQPQIGTESLIVVGGRK